MLLPHIRQLKTYDGVDPMEVMAERAGIPRDQVIRLNGNENPYGPSPRVVQALGRFKHYNHYPDPDQRRLREVLSDYLGVAPNQIVAGNGSDELIDIQRYLCKHDHCRRTFSILPHPFLRISRFSLCLFHELLHAGVAHEIGVHVGLSLGPADVELP